MRKLGFVSLCVLFALLLAACGGTAAPAQAPAADAPPAAEAPAADAPAGEVAKEAPALAEAVAAERCLHWKSACPRCRLSSSLVCC